jgi:hypothetical protein
MYRVLGKTILALTAIIIASAILWRTSKTPSLERTWNTDQAILPTIYEYEPGVFQINSIRNFSYTSTTTYTPAYYNKTFVLNDLHRVWFVVEPFAASKDGAAHTLLSFEFASGTSSSEFLAISVEIRKEVGESFSALKGLFNEYELMYVLADERDVLGLRANHRRDDVYLYPIRTTPEQARALFTTMLARTNSQTRKPVFYNTFTKNCTTEIWSAVNSIRDERIPWTKALILPAYSDKVAYDLGLIDTSLTFEEAKKEFLINERAWLASTSPDFSARIRSRD